MGTPLVMEYPSWHDEARKDKEAGMSIAQIADKYGVSQSRVSQIATANWQAYLLMHRLRPTQNDFNLAKGQRSLREGTYTFSPRPQPSPKEYEAKRKSEKKVVKRFEDIPMARFREFEEVRKFEGGKTLIGARITCCKCGKQETYYKHGGSVNPAYLEKEFIRLGWFVGKTKGMDMCPDDIAKMNAKPKASTGIQAVQVEPKGLEAVKLGVPLKGDPMPTVTPAKAEEAKPFVPSFKVTGELPIDPPKPALVSTPAAPTPVPPAVPAAADRAMTRSDDQIIYLKLMDVYVDERSGYKDDWTDAKLATELGVPVDWVTLVRDRSFGPEINPVMRQQAQENITKMAEEVEQRILLIDKKMEQMQALDDKLVALNKEIAAQIDRYEQLIKNLETEDKHMESLIKGFDGKVEDFKKIFSESKALALAS